MVSQYAAIELIGKRTSKEFSGPVTLGGVGNAQITSSHGTYQIKLPLFNGNDVALSGMFGPDHSGVSLISVKGAGRSWCQKWLHIKWKRP